jgi:hypothetical protein
LYIHIVRMCANIFLRRVVDSCRLWQKKQQLENGEGKK